MSDFKLAKIYKIQPLNPVDKSDIYIGSTCKAKLSYRMSNIEVTINSGKKEMVVILDLMIYLINMVLKIAI